MDRNMLKLNDDKTELIVFKSNVNTFVEQNVQVNGREVGIISKVREWGNI